MCFAAVVAAFGQLLRGGRYTGDCGYEDVAALALGARGDDPFGYRNEFIGLVRLARSIADSLGARSDDPFSYRNEFIGLVRLARFIADTQQ